MEHSISKLFSYAKSLYVQATGDKEWKDFTGFHNYLADNGWVVVITPNFYKTGITYDWQVLIWDDSQEDYVSEFSTGMYGDDGKYKTYYEAFIYGTLRALELYCLFKTVDMKFNKELGEDPMSNLMDLHNKYDMGLLFLIVDQDWWKYERKTATEYIEYIKKRLKEIKEWKDA